MALSFPTDPQEFDSDERISFSRLDNKFIAVQDDGAEFEFDAQLKRWIPVIDEELLAQQQSAYGGSADVDDDDGEAAGNNGARPSRKRKKELGADGAHKNKKLKQPPKPRENTAIFVTGLPLDTTVDEVHDVFSKKCGVVAEEIDSGRPRIKLYSGADGTFKGEALVVFFKPQSVEMAIMLLDDTVFRYSSSGLSSGKIRVQAADSSYKKTHYEPAAAEEGSGAGAATVKEGEPRASEGPVGSDAPAGDNMPPPQKPRNKSSEQDKQKIIKRTQKLDAKLADWDDDDPYGAQTEPAARREKVVILRHMFTQKEIQDDPAVELDIKEDVREECAKLGDVTNVVLYDLEEEGIISVRFKTAEAAEACVEMMDGRAFDGRTVKATIAKPRERYRKSGKKFDSDDEDE